MPRHENTGRRRSPRADGRHTVLVYCGGARTEPDYLAGLKQQLRRSNVTIKVRSTGVDPAGLARTAAAYRDQRPAVFDETWCVVDTDEFDIAAAADVAAKHRVNLAVSNPCFELWLLLHHTDCQGYCDGCSDVQRRLRQYVPDYDKARLEFSRFAPGVNDAVVRARKLEPTGTAHSRNPSSGIGRLVETIMELR